MDCAVCSEIVISVARNLNCVPWVQVA